VSQRKELIPATSFGAAADIQIAEEQERLKNKLICRYPEIPIYRDIDIPLSRKINNRI
jgi:hypothetical protein